MQEEIVSKMMECPVCLETYPEHGAARTACGHRFCPRCIEESMQRLGATCPLCRAPIEAYTAPEGHVRVLVLGPVAPRAEAPSLGLGSVRRTNGCRSFCSLLLLLWALWMIGTSSLRAIHQPPGNSCTLDDAVCYFHGAPPDSVRALCAPSPAFTPPSPSTPPVAARGPFERE